MYTANYASNQKESRTISGWNTSDEELLNTDISLEESDIINERHSNADTGGKENGANEEMSNKDMLNTLRDIDGISGKDRETLAKIYDYLKKDEEDDERMLRHLIEFERKLDKYYH